MRRINPRRYSYIGACVVGFVVGGVFAVVWLGSLGHDRAPGWVVASIAVVAASLANPAVAAVRRHRARAGRARRAHVR